MAVGAAKHKHKITHMTYKDRLNEPEEVHLASRAQMNQVEQMASYLVPRCPFCRFNQLESSLPMFLKLLAPLRRELLWLCT